MQYHRPLEVPLSSASPDASLHLSASHNFSLSQLTERVLHSLHFCHSLSTLPHVKTSDREALRARAVEILDSSAWLEQNHFLALPTDRVLEFVAQRLSRQFFITERFTAFATGANPYVEPRTESLESRIAALNSSQVALISEVHKFCPLSAGIVGAFLAEQLTPAKAAGPAGVLAVEVARQHQKSLDITAEAINAVDLFLSDTFIRNSKALSEPSQAILTAWRQDLILPVIEAAIFSVAAGVTPLATGHQAGGSWYTPRFQIPAERTTAKRFYNDWRDLARMSEVFRRLSLYEGIDVSGPEGKASALEERLLPIPLLVGTEDTRMFMAWYRDSFQALNNSLNSSQIADLKLFLGGGWAQFSDGSQLVLRSRQDSQGQQRIGITTSQESGNVSIRLDFDKERLALDFGAVNAREMLERAKEIIRDNRREVTYYNQLRSEFLKDPENTCRGRGGRFDNLTRLNQAAEHISHFTLEPGQSIPSFIAAMSGVGRSLGLRADDSFGHHLRESAYRLSLTRSNMKNEFEEFISAVADAAFRDSKWH